MRVLLKNLQKMSMSVTCEQASSSSTTEVRLGRSTAVGFGRSASPLWGCGCSGWGWGRGCRGEWSSSRLWMSSSSSLRLKDLWALTVLSLEVCGDLPPGHLCCHLVERLLQGPRPLYIPNATQLSSGSIFKFLKRSEKSLCDRFLNLPLGPKFGPQGWSYPL
jgi:hypothetical protein